MWLWLLLLLLVKVKVKVSADSDGTGMQASHLPVSVLARCARVQLWVLWALLLLRVLWVSRLSLPPSFRPS